MRFAAMGSWVLLFASLALALSLSPVCLGRLRLAPLQRWTLSVCWQHVVAAIALDVAIDLVVFVAAVEAGL
jgi:hypothetical protein